jgi:Raf kinase inhibitor-like YbhB/YbcL family protein
MTRTDRLALAGFVLLAACGSEETSAVVLPAAKGGEYGPALTLTSSAFADGDSMPVDFTCDGQDRSPPLSWSNVPQGTTSFALVVDDPDAPRRQWVHWVAWGIGAEERLLAENQPTQVDEFQQGTNDSGDVGWTGPCPPKADDAHHYEFHVFAVDYEPSLESTTTRDQLYRELDGRVLAMGELTGVFDH